MQLRRLVLAALVLGSAITAVPASAAVAKKVPCRQLTDPEGDGVINPVGLSSPALDILSADISTGKNEVTAILRLKSTAVENDNYLRGGAIWNFNVTAGGIKYTFNAHWPTAITPNPALSGSLTAGNSTSSPAATFRRVGNDFIWTVSRAAIPALKKAKTYIFITSASDNADSLSGDSAYAPTNAKYLDKTVTCLPSK